MSDLQEGQAAPNFQAKDESGNNIQLSDFKGKKNVILYFYPKDDTPGCTIEACNFRDNLNQFQTADTQILGVSYDDAASHRAFKEKFHLNFPLLVDSDKKIAEAYGVQAMQMNGQEYAARDTIVIGKDGKVKKVLRKVDPKSHAAELLGILSK